MAASSSPTKRMTLSEAFRLAKQMDPARIRSAAWLSSVDSRVALGAALTLLLISFGFASYMLNSALNSKARQTQVLANTFVLPSVSATPLNGTEIAQKVEVLRKTYNSLQFNQSNETIIINSNDASQFDQFLQGVNAVRAMDTKIRWEVEEICVGPKCSAPFMITLKPLVYVIQ